MSPLNIHPHTLELLKTVPDFMRADFKEAFADQPEWFAAKRSRKELLNRWLEWNGIIGYTDRIEHAVHALGALT